MNKQFTDHSTHSDGDPKEKKIVNEQEQNKPVNTGDQPFNNEDPEVKENEKAEKKEGTASQTSKDEIVNKGDEDILNKDPDILPE